VGRTVRFPEQEIIVSKYSIAIDQLSADDQGDGQPIVAAIGSLKLVTAAAKEGLEAIKEQPGEFVARVTETSGDGREVVQVKATEDIVRLVVNKRLKDEKAQNAPVEATAQTGATPTEDNPQGELPPA
jgi:hypothetical protein